MVINETINWSEQRWHQAQLAAVERAYQHFADIHVLRPMLEDWLRIAHPSVRPSVKGLPGESSHPSHSSISRDTASAAA